MDIILDKNSATEALIKITLKETDYQPKVEEKVKDYSRKAQIKGFRPGKVPPAIIKKMYGKSILLEEINELLSKSVTDYIKDNQLKLIGDPLPNTDKTAQIDWDNQKEFEFEYSVGMVDNFTIDFSKKINSFEVEADEKSINETLLRLKKQYGNHTEPEQTGEGDDLFGKLNQPATGLQEEVWLIHDQLNKKEAEKLIGLKKDEVIRVNIGNLFNEQKHLSNALRKTEEELKNLNGEFEFTLTKVSHVQPAEMNQEFFDKIFGKDTVTSESEFLEKLKETIQKNYNTEAEQYTEKLIRETLIKNTRMDIPENFYKKWLLASNRNQLTPEEVDKNFEHYITDLKWSLIINKMAEENGIKVEHEHILEHTKNLIRAQFASYGISESMNDNLDSMANNFLKARDGENYYNIFNQVRNEMIMKAIREKTEIVKKKVSPSEFLSILESKLL